MRIKWHLITRVTDAGLLQLVSDLSDFYDRYMEPFDDVEIRVRRSNHSGPYQVNVLTKDWDAMLHRRVNHDAEQRYRVPDAEQGISE